MLSLAVPSKLINPMLMKSLFVSGILSLSVIAGFSQTVQVDTSTSTWLSLKKQVEHGSYFTAIPALKKIVAAYPKHQKSQQLLGEALQECRLHAEAAAAFEAAYNPKAKGSARLLLPILQNFYQAGNPEKTKTWAAEIEKRRDADGPTKAKAKQVLVALDEIARADSISSRYMMDTTFRFPNSGYSDFAPGRMNDSTLVFSSLRQDSVAFYDPAAANFNTTRIHIYRTTSSPTFEKIEAPRVLSPPGIHSGNGSFTPDGKHFYFSRCFDGADGKLHCAIYQAEVANGSFKNVRKLDGAINKSGSNNSQPYVVTTTTRNVLIETLYFVSDRKGGAGGTDIWTATFNPKKKRFSNAVNLGRTVNSPGDEASPYLDEVSNGLYFSSNGHTGHGGFDIFLSKKVGNGFGKPINLGKPVNSAADDRYFRHDGASGAFLASNRKGAHELADAICCEDIFYLKRLPKLDSMQWMAFQQIANSGMSPSAKKQPALDQPLPEEPVKPVLAEVPPVLEPKTAKVEVGKVDPTHKNDSKGVNIQTTNLMKAISQNIQFETGSNRLTTSTLPHLDSLASLLKANKKYRLVLTGHTDNKGSANRNLKLSKLRAEAVKLYLVQKGITKNRISTLAKGPSMPLLPNQNPDGSDNPVNRAKNRRVTLLLKKG